MSNENNQQFIENEDSFSNNINTNSMTRPNQNKHVSIDVSSLNEQSIQTISQMNKNRNEKFDIPNHPLEIGDIVTTNDPLKGVRMKVRSIINQQIAEVDLLNSPIIGKCDQFKKIQPNIYSQFEKSIYETSNKVYGPAILLDPSLTDKFIPNNDPNARREVETQCNSIDLGLYRTGDFIEIDNEKIGVIYRIAYDEDLYYVLGLDNKEIQCEQASITNNFKNDNSCIDNHGNRLFMGDNVLAKNGGHGTIIGTYKKNVLVLINQSACFYSDFDLILEDNYNSSSGKNNNNNNFSNNNNNNYNNNNDRNNYSNYNDRIDYNNFNNNNNNNGRGGYDNFNNHSGYDDYNYRSGYGNFNDRISGYDNMNRNQFDNNRPPAQPQPQPQQQNKPQPQQQNKPQPSIQPTPSKKPVKPEVLPAWAYKGCMVRVPDRNEDAVIMSVQDDKAKVQFLINKLLHFKKYEYKISDLKPLSIRINDSAIVPKRGGQEELYGKVIRIGRRHLTLDIGKKYDPIEVIKDEAFRFFDWDSLEKI